MELQYLPGFLNFAEHDRLTEAFESYLLHIGEIIAFRASLFCDYCVVMIGKKTKCSIFN